MQIAAIIFGCDQVGPNDFDRITYSRTFCESDTLESVIEWYMSKFPGAKREQVLNNVNFAYLEKQ